MLLDLFGTAVYLVSNFIFELNMLDYRFDLPYDASEIPNGLVVYLPHLADE